jgi:APA family basic amino acid/polyamine antiporter
VSAPAGPAAAAADSASAGRLGFWMAVALVVGNMIGSGVFLLPASLAPYGVNGLSGWLFSAAGAVALALVFAALSRAFPHDGGLYLYTRVAFGPLPAFVVAWGYWVSVWVGNAAIATGGVSYLSALFPAIARAPGVSVAATLGALWLLTLVNCAGVRAAGWVQTVTTVLKVLPLLAVAALGAGLFFVKHPLPGFAGGTPLSLDGTTAAATLTLWALLGLESATVPADKVENPEKTVPRATVVGTVVTAVISAAACGVVLLLVPSSELAASNAPFADAVRPLWGEGAATLVALFAAISAFGALNGWILLQGELPWAMARDGVFPRVFARESRRGTPVFAFVFTSGLVTLLVLANAHASMVEVFTFMILLSTSASLVAYLVCSLALLDLMRRGRLPGRGRGTAWLAGVGVLGAAFSLWALAGAGRETLLWGLALLLVAVPVYGLMRRAQGSRES